MLYLLLCFVCLGLVSPMSWFPYDWVWRVDWAYERKQMATSLSGEKELNPTHRIDWFFLPSLHPYRSMCNNARGDNYWTTSFAMGSPRSTYAASNEAEAESMRIMTWNTVRLAMQYPSAQMNGYDKTNVTALGTKRMMVSGLCSRISSSPDMPICVQSRPL